MLKVFFFILHFAIIEYSTLQNSGLDCNSHQTTRISAYDTTASCVEFIILDSLNNPISGCEIIVRKSNRGKVENLSQLKSNKKGWCKSSLFHFKPPLDITVFKNSKEFYSFLINQNPIGYN